MSQSFLFAILACNLIASKVDGIWVKQGSKETRYARVSMLLTRTSILDYSQTHSLEIIDLFSLHLQEQRA